MTVETIGEALRLSWRVRAKCARGGRAGLKSIRECQRAEELDLSSLVWTRGRNFPLSRLGERMMCPACGSLKVTVTFEPPKEPIIGGGPTQPDRFTDLPVTVDHFSAGGSVRRRLAAAVNGDVAFGAFEAAVREISLEAGEEIAMRQGARMLHRHIARESAEEASAEKRRTSGLS